jgi:hypothetical protein
VSSWHSDSIEVKLAGVYVTSLANREMEYGQLKWPVVTAGWVLGLCISASYKQSGLYVCLTLLLFIFTNLASSSSGPSAYSIFNKNCRSLLGATDAAALDAQFRHKLHEEDKEEPPPSQQEVKRDGRSRNKACPCGSGLKLKKCCWDAKTEEDENYW